MERPLHANEILAERGDQLIVFELQGYIFFGSAIALLERIRQRIEQDWRTLRYVVLGFRHVVGMDASAAFALKKLKLYTRANGIALLFANLDDACACRLVAAGVLTESERFPETGHAMEWVEDRLLGDAGYRDGEIVIEELLAELLNSRKAARTLQPYLTEREFAACELLFKEGDFNNDIYIVLRGSLSAMAGVGRRKPMRLRKFTAGSVVGGMAF